MDTHFFTYFVIWPRVHTISFLLLAEDWPWIEGAKEAFPSVGTRRTFAADPRMDSHHRSCHLGHIVGEEWKNFSAEIKKVAGAFRFSPVHLENWSSGVHVNFVLFWALNILSSLAASCTLICLSFLLTLLLLVAILIYFQCIAHYYPLKKQLQILRFHESMFHVR